ncbi:MAG: type II toxin-antitoxin system RatA family toxin [Gammaproteobacteria bacterium]|nr:type II toxin-antitoxin system RatA family toxin [Gammaproteobacteria bacterium]
MNVVRSALLPYSASDMYRVVADIESYPQFIKFCTGADIISRDGDITVAKVHIEYSKLNIQFTTRNQNFPGRLIKMEKVDGPFIVLQGEWRFDALTDSACKVSVEMNFDFDNNVANTVLGPVFKKTIAMQLQAFQNRAEQLYAGQGSEAENA